MSAHRAATLLHPTRYLKAIGSAVVAAAAYLVGVLPDDAGLLEGLAALSGVKWLGLVLFLGSAFGVTYALPNRAPAGKP